MAIPRTFLSWLLPVALMVLVALPCHAQDAPPDDYSGMLDYLVDSRIDGRAFAGAHGAIAVNMAAGDLNQQANLRSLAHGDMASAEVTAQQQHQDNQYDMPLDASASIGGRAFDQASGLVSINQVSGSGNSELNSVAVSLANQGIRETTDGGLSSVVSASAGGQSARDPGEARNGTRSVAVEATALMGLDGVLQLNQVAGSGNATVNQLGISVQRSP